jgi:hypothetical protein
MINPTFEILWKQIAEAYQQVANSADRTIEFEHDKYRVKVWDNQDGAVHVLVWEDNKPDPPTLIAP